MLTEDQIARYSRHIILKEVGGKGQKKLFDGKVMIIGAGGLGSPIASTWRRPGSAPSALPMPMW